MTYVFDKPQPRYTYTKGWLWDGIQLLEDVKVEDVDDSHFFTIMIGSNKANICGRASRRRPRTATAEEAPGGGGGARGGKDAAWRTAAGMGAGAEL